MMLLMERIRHFQQQQQQADQPLDFSAQAKRSPDYQPTYNLSLDSAGNSPFSTDQSGSISPSGSHSSTDSLGHKEPKAGSCSPPRPALPRISIPTPSPSSSPACRPDLLTTIPNFPSVSLRPLASLQADTKPLLGLPFLPTSLPFPFHPTVPQFSMKPSPHTDLAQVNSESQRKYSEFRENMLKGVKREAEEEAYPAPLSPTPSSHNSSLPLSSTPTHSSTPSRVAKDGKDAAYWERRRKNNAAAKRSRDSRRAKEQEVHIRAKYLEQENSELRVMFAQATAEAAAARAEVQALQAEVRAMKSSS